MAEGNFVSETRGLSHSMEQMCMNTPLGKKAPYEFEGRCFESDLSAPLSPPQTADTKQKRERSESLMQCQTNDMIATKRRLRSRSRLGLAPEGIPSSFMSPPCSSKPRERAHSRAQNPSEKLFSYPEEITKHLAFDREASSVYMTPVSEPREPLQCKDMNSLSETNTDHLSSFDQLRLSSQLDCPSDSSSSDEETIPCSKDKTRTKLNFDQYADHAKTEKRNPVTPEHCRIIGRRMHEKKIDFIKELVNMNCEEICKQIFCQLEPRDLQRVASVSKLWRKICKKDRIASPRLDQFISGRKQHVKLKGKENLGHHTKFDYVVPQRPPFTVQDHNMIWTPPPQHQSANAIEAVKTNIVSTYERIKCPSCGSPSRKTANNTCECEECKEIFCSLCQHRVDKNHKIGKCGIKPNKSKNLKGKEAIGSRKSKDRLKRY